MAALKGLLQLPHCMLQPISRFSDHHPTHARKTHGAQQLFLGCKQSQRKGSTTSVIFLRAAGIAGKNGDLKEGEEKEEEDGSSSDGKKTKELKEWEWLRQELAMELQKGGLVGEETSRRISEACADGCEKFMSSGHGTFDPMVIMDAIEEEVERRDLRGDFLPFEIGRKATKLLTQRWGVLPASSRPRLYRDAFDNKLDVVDFERFPKPPPPGCSWLMIFCLNKTTQQTAILCMSSELQFFGIKKDHVFTNLQKLMQLSLLWFLQVF